jgi:hypothetical protein
MIFEVFSLDFTLQPWVLSHGEVLEKGICFLIQKNDYTPGGMFPWSSTMEHWNWIVIFTSRGKEMLIIPKAICDCVEPGDSLPIEVQKSLLTFFSFYFRNRVRIRLAREKRLEKQPV